MINSGTNAKAIILGSGASGGIPRIDGYWGACDPNNLKNHRTRCSLFFKFNHKNYIIDTSPDIRFQLLREKIFSIDSVFYTHEHADQVHGIDDIRALTFVRKKPIDAYADRHTAEVLKKRFQYIFYAKDTARYPAIMNLNAFEHDFFCVSMQTTIETFDCPHGSIIARGYIIGDMAYSPDVHDLSKSTLQILKEKKLSYWIVDCLRDMPHPTHAHYDRVIEWFEIVQPKKMILTNLLFDFDYEILSKRVPHNIIVGYDGLSFDFQIS